MPGLTWVLAASAAIWIGLAAYLALLAFRQKTLDTRLHRLENARDHV